jgi:hypothetical protein
MLADTLYRNTSYMFSRHQLVDSSIMPACTQKQTAPFVNGAVEPLH